MDKIAEDGEHKVCGQESRRPDISAVFQQGEKANNRCGHQLENPMGRRIPGAVLADANDEIGQLQAEETQSSSQL